MEKFEVLKKYFGYDSFREGQEVLINAILNGQDVLGIIPTGAGKSICYQVPALLGLELFEVLRGLRTEIAREEAIPPYMIFSDKTLVDMCVKIPFTKAEMLDVSGVGENKYAKYGERFINQIQEYTNGVKEKFYFGELTEAVLTRPKRQKRISY